MSCTNDQLWPWRTLFGSSYFYEANVGDCVKWGIPGSGHFIYDTGGGTGLMLLRVMYNEVWDLLNNETGAGRNGTHVKYGSAGNQEQIEELATIKGFFSVKLDITHTVQEVYFIITGGTILDRIDEIGTNYSYVSGGIFGDWIVYLNDPCFGCTGFKFNQVVPTYPRTVQYNGEEISDPTTYRVQPITSSSVPAPPLTNSGSICNMNVDWGATPDELDAMSKTAVAIAQKYSKCYPLGDSSFTPEEPFGCGGSVSATGILTEAISGTPPATCPTGSVYRWVEFVNIGADAAFVGVVTQEIKATHLGDIWDGLSGAGGQLRNPALLTCVGESYLLSDSDDYYTDPDVIALDPRYLFLYGAYIGLSDLAQRWSSGTGAGSICSTCAEGHPSSSTDICACQWNELVKIMSLLVTPCSGTGGISYTPDVSAFGPIDTYNCVIGLCCTDDPDTSDDNSFAGCMAVGGTWTPYPDGVPLDAFCPP